jgi:hypothetical protein
MQTAFPKPPFEPQPQPVPGSSSAMRPQPDYGEGLQVGDGKPAADVTRSPKVMHIYSGVLSEHDRTV